MDIQRTRQAIATKMVKLFTFLAISIASVSGKSSLPAGSLEMELSRIVHQTAYGVKMEIGTPPQPMTVLIDTGSPFMGLAGTNSNWCTLPKKPCQKYGSYDNLTSSTAKFINHEFNNVLVNRGSGDYIRDTVRIGGQTYPRIIFGMILDYNAGFPAPRNIPGLVGLIPTCFNRTGTACSKPPMTFQQRLIDRGFLKRHVVSIYLGPEDIDARGQLLFGAVDRAKQLGKPVTFPLIEPSEPISNGAPNVAVFSSMSVKYKAEQDGDSPVTKHFNISKSSFGILDTGNPMWYLPTPAWDYVKKYFGITHVDYSREFLPVDCKFRKPQKDGATLLVGFANDTLQIEIPMERLVTQLSPGHCGTAAQPCGDRGRGCAFGDPFLRSAYLSFNFESFEITMSNVRYTNKTDIVAA